MRSPIVLDDFILDITKGCTLSGPSKTTEARRSLGMVHELAEATEHVHQQAELERHHFTWREEQSLLALHALAEAADHLHEQVESYWQDPTQTYLDYQQVALAMQHARWSLRAGHFSEHVLDDWFRAENAFQRLQYEYTGGGGDGGHGGYYPGHGDYPGYSGGYYPGYGGYPYPGHGGWIQ